MNRRPIGITFLALLSLVGILLAPVGLALLIAFATANDLPRVQSQVILEHGGVQMGEMRLQLVCRE